MPISSRGSSDPEQALRDAETVKRAAMAPAEPSSQDRSVAAQASADINRLRGEVAEARRKKMEGGEGEEGQAAKGLNSETAAGKAGEEEAGAAQASMNMAAQMTQSGQAQKARGQDLSQAGQAQKDQPAKLSGLDSMGIAAPKRLSANGESFGSHVLSAYAAAKSAVMSGYRPALATA